MKRVVIVKMWAIGDILMATPMIAALRARYPDVKITWVVDESYGEILKGHPDIDDLEIIHSGRWRRLLRKANIPAWLAESRRLRQLIEGYRPDAVINCHPEKWWTVYLCPAPVRVGLFSSQKLPWTKRFYTHAISDPGLQHNTCNYLMATDALGCPPASLQMTIGEATDEQVFITAFREQNRLQEGRPVVLFSPFSTADNRNWEPERYAALSDWLVEKYSAEVVLSFASRDSERAKEIIKKVIHPVHIASGTTLRQYLALLQHADLILCVDSSAMHIAAALKRPFVALFGATPSEERFPLVGNGLPVVNIDGLSCAPCDGNRCANRVFRACMKQITLDMVQRAVAEKLPHPIK